MTNGNVWGRNSDGTGKTLENWTDLFGTQIANRNNRLDIGSHYPQNPERLRIFVDGTRQLRMYNTISQYNHAGPVHELIPGDNETVVLETTERPRYVVQYESRYTTACRLSRALQTGDMFRWGAWDGDDGWYIEHTGSDSAGEATLVGEQNGSQVQTETADLSAPLTDFTRLALRTAWYRVSRQEWQQSYAENGQQVNDTIGTTGDKDTDGPDVGNLPMRYEITRGTGNDPITLEAGSIAHAVLGSSRSITRDKKIFSTANIDTSGSWIPVKAFRVDPDREIVNVQLEGFTLEETSTSADTFLLFQAFDPSKVADSGGNPLEDADFDTPPETQATNSVIETTTAVDQVANANGTVQTSVSDPGGYQLRASAIYTGVGQNTTGVEAPQAVTKRELSARDIGVVLAKSSSTGNIGYSTRFEQDW